MAAGVPNVRIGIGKSRNTSSVVSRVYGCVRYNLRWGVTEEDVVGKQDGACCNRHVGVP